MGMNWLAHLAARAEVPVFLAEGEAAPAEYAHLLARMPALRMVDTPRAAAILLVVGTVPKALLPQLHRLHDQLPHPRATILWQSRNDLSGAKRINSAEDIGTAIKTIHSDLLADNVESEPDILPDAPANEWRGVGPHGQGGKGMMGGTPYGRPMAMTAADLRDGLELDTYTADFGPFLPMFPPGLVLKLTLQGDVIQTVAVTHPPFETTEDRGWVLLDLLGLPALAQRKLRGDASAKGSFDRLARLTAARAAIPDGLGRTHDGSDVRARFDYLMSRRGTALNLHLHHTGLDDLLVGLEWHEAMLVLNSFDTASLRTICANTPEPETDDDTDDKDGNKEGGMDHGAHAGHM